MASDSRLNARVPVSLLQLERQTLTGTRILRIKAQSWNPCFQLLQPAYKFSSHGHRVLD